MMQGNPFADLIPQQPAAPRNPVLGTPRPPAPPPPPNPGTGYVLNPDGTASQIPGGAGDPRRPGGEQDPNRDPAVTQAQASGFLRRAARANNLYLRQNVGAPSLAAENARGPFPNLTNAARTPEMRQAISAQDEFIAATLRQESGAAIPEPELEAQRRRYFPMPFDDPATIQQKAELRRTVLEGLTFAAGPGADEALAVGETADIRASIDRARQEGSNTIPYRVSANIGGRSQTIEVPGPPGLTPEQATQLADRYLRENYPGQRFAPATYRQPQGQAPQQTPEAPADGGLLNDLAVGVGDVIEGAGDILGLVANPLNAGINWATGSNLGTDLGQAARDATGLPSPQGGQQELVSAINRGGVGALAMAGLGGGGARLATGAVQSAAQRLAATPLVDTVAGASAGGASDTTRQAGYGTAAQLLAALAGGGAGVAGASRAGRRFASAGVPSHPLLTAGQAENVTVNRAMIDPEVRQRLTAVDRTMAGGPIVQRGMGGVASQIEDRVQALGQGGTALDDANAGEMVRQASTRSIARSGARARDMYDAAESASEGVRIPPERSLGVVDDVITRLSETGNINSAELTFLRGLREDLTNNLSVGGLRRIRTQLRKRISNGGLVFGEDEGTVLGIMDAASQDIEAGLRAADRGRAATLFRRADDFYRDRMTFITGTLQRLIGRRNAELPPGQVAANLRAMAAPRGDNAGLARMMREMEPEEQADIAATFAESLGRNQQGEFSAAALISQARRLPERARVNIFGERGAQSLDNLVQLAREVARVQRGMGGSPTGVANDWRSMFLGPIFSGMGGAVLAGMTTGGVTPAAIAGVATASAVRGGQVARNVISARALMSPDVTQWLRDIPRGGAVGPVRQHIARLSQIAAREPSLAGDIQQLQQAVLQALNDNVPVGATASPERGDDRD